MRHIGGTRRRGVAPGSYLPLAHALAWLFAAGAVFSAASLALVAAAMDWRPTAALDVVAVLAAAALWRRAPRLSRWELRGLAITGAAAVTLALYQVDGPSQVGAGSVELSRWHWFLTIATFLLGGVLIQRLVHQLRRHVEQLEALARTDQLTGVANRRAWDERLTEQVESRLGAGGSLCVAILDIDHFKAYNDIRGHLAGDDLLRRTASAWSGQLRDEDLVARYGGEEFGVLLVGCRLNEGVAIVERLREAVPDGESCSAGIAAWDGTETAESLVARADDALYQAKRAGRDRIVASEWDRGSSAVAADESAVLSVVHGAGVIAAFQPVVRVPGGQVIGYEALARPLGPAARMPVARLFELARRTGRMRDLDWVARRAALRDAMHLPAGTPVFLNVGLSYLLDPVHDADQLLLLLRYHERDPRTVILEISQADAVHDQEVLAAVVAAHRAHGFRFSLDDVGARGIDLVTLDTVRPEYIKVAPSLIRRAVEQGEPPVLRALAAFARSTGALLVAEAVEDEGVAARLPELGFDAAQGYLYGRPTADMSAHRRAGEAPVSRPTAAA